MADILYRPQCDKLFTEEIKSCGVNLLQIRNKIDNCGPFY